MESRLGEAVNAFRHGRVSGALAPLAALLAYARVLAADGLVWDDRIVARWQTPLFSGFLDAFFPPSGVPNMEKAYYRPLVWGSYRLEALFAAPGSAFGILLAHSTNLFLHALVSYLLFRLALELFGAEAKFPALAAALLFAVHPVHAESVCSIAGRTDLFAAVFLLGAFLAALAYGRWGGVVRLALAGFLFFAGTLSKEVAVGGLFALPLIWFSGGFGKSRRLVAALSIFSAGLAGWLALRSLSGAGVTTSWGFSPAVLPELMELAARFLYRSFLPWPKSLYAMDKQGIIVSVALLAVVALASILAARKVGLRKPLALLWGWFLLFVAPALGARLIGVTANPGADRYLYIPSMAACLAVGYSYTALGCGGRVGRKALLVLAAVAVFFGAVSFSRAGYWHNDRTFWSAVLMERGAQTDPVVLANSAIAERDAGNYPAALEYAQRAADLFPRPADKVKAAALAAEITAREALELAKKGETTRAIELADAALVGISAAYRGGAIPTLQRLSVATALFARAEALAKMGRIDAGAYGEALANVDAALQRLPGDSYALELKNEITGALGRVR